VIKTVNGTPIRVKDLGTVSQGPKIRLGQIGKAIHRGDGKVIDDGDVVEGIVLLRKGADADAVLDAIHAKVDQLNQHILPPGVQVVPFLDRSSLVHLTTHTVLHNLTEGIVLVALILFLFLGNARGALIVALTIPFSLLFAAICLNLNHIPANLLSLGALDFGMVVEGAVVIVENIVRYLGRRDGVSPIGPVRAAAHEVQRPVFYSIGIIITAYLPIFTLQRVEGRLFKPMAWTVSFALLGSLLFSLLVAPVLSSFVFGKRVREWHNPAMNWITRVYSAALRAAIRLRWGTVLVAATARGCFDLSGHQRHHRLRVPAASRRRRHLGARHAGPQHRSFGRRARDEPGAAYLRIVSRSHPSGEPGGPA
jgi:heavy metal efflux system protein